MLNVIIKNPDRGIETLLTGQHASIGDGLL